MQRWTTTALLLLSILFLSGCWSKKELTEEGFVMAAAIDSMDNGRIGLAVQIYKPAQTIGPKGGQGKSYFRINTENATLRGAILDISIHLGRKAQWSHMSTILIGEQMARTKPIGQTLEPFYRDPEPRLTSKIIVTKGRASQYLDISPYVESTSGRQFTRMLESTSQNAAKTIDMSLLELAFQLKSQTEDAVIPYLYLDKSALSVAGAALVKNGKMTGLLSPRQIEGLLMLTNKFKSGIITIPCTKKAGKKNEVESLGIVSFKTKVTPIIHNNMVSVDVSANISGSAYDLKCSSIDSPTAQKEFTVKAQNVVEEIMKTTIKSLQNQKTDLIGIGNRIYGKHPYLWKSWKSDWRERFSHISFSVQAQVSLSDTGNVGGKPVFTQTGE
jgi:spore germination protein KC